MNQNERKGYLAQKAKYIAYTVSYGVPLFLLSLPKRVLATGSTTTTPGNYKNKTIDDFSMDLVDNYVYPAVITLFFIGGVISVGMGIFAIMNKESNPQAAHGAWKKIVGGAALLLFSSAVGILYKTFETTAAK